MVAMGAGYLELVDDLRDDDGAGILAEGPA
jgi:hypothetical protein